MKGVPMQELAWRVVLGLILVLAPACESPGHSSGDTDPSGRTYPSADVAMLAVADAAGRGDREGV